MRRARYGVVMAVAWVVACVSTGAAGAVVPSNDTFAGATPISALPFSQTIDTTEATTDADDAEANAECGAPVTEASVWYALSPSSSQFVLVDVSRSNYPAGVIVATGAPGNFTFRTCGARRAAFGVRSGETYYIMVFDYIPGGTNGGTLQLSVTQAPPPPELHVTIDPFGHFVAKTGVVTVTGTYTCSGVVEGPVFIDAYMTQDVGRLSISGYGFRVFPSVCDGTSQPWTINLRGQNGRFGGGRATLSVEAFACGPLQCGDDQATQTIRLRR